MEHDPAGKLVEDRRAPHVGARQLPFGPERQLGERLRRRDMVAGRGTLRHGPLRRGHDQLAGAAIEHEQIAGLGRLQNRGNDAAGCGESTSVGCDGKSMSHRS